MSAEVLEHLRSRERAAFELWSDTPADHPLLHARGAAWIKAFQVLNDEISARLAVLLQARPDVRTEVRP